MKIFTDEAMAAIAAGTAQVGGAAAIRCDPPVFVWSGSGKLPLPGDGGDDFYIGLGAQALVEVTTAAIGAAAQQLTLKLSGIDPKALELLDADELRQAPVAVWRLIFDASGTRLLDAHVFARGRVDRVPREEVPGGTAAISLLVEGAARGLGRRTNRMRTDADQRLIDPIDGGLRRVTYAGEKTLYWAGERPARAGSSLPG